MRIGNVQDGFISLNNPRYVSDLTDQHTGVVLNIDDILVSLTGNVGRVGMITSDHLPAVVNQRVTRLRMKRSDIADHKFFFYFLNSSIFRDDLTAKARGAAQLNVAPREVGSYEVPRPPLPEQQRIVAILDEAFDGIASAVAATEQNLVNARELFESRLNAVFSQNGDGYAERELGDVCTLQRGFDLPTRLRTTGQYPLISSSGQIDTHTEAKVSGPGVVTGRSGSIGAVFFVEEDFWPLNTALYVKDFHGNAPEYVFHLLESFDLSRFASGAGVPTLNRNNVHSEKVSIVLSVTEQERIAEMLKSLRSEIQDLESIYNNKLSSLTELKQSILQKAFAGELTAEPDKALAAAGL